MLQGSQGTGVRISFARNPLGKRSAPSYGQGGGAGGGGGYQAPPPMGGMYGAPPAGGAYYGY